MANVLTNFLIGVGFNFDERGAKQADRAINNVKSSALQAGAAVGAMFGAKALTIDFAQKTDAIGKFADVFGVTAQGVSSLGLALQQEGGSLESFMGQLSNIERMRAGLLQGDAGFIAEAGRAGLDANAIMNAKNATEAYIAIADQFDDLSKQQRINVAGALGLDEASIRLLSKGSEHIKTVMGQFDTIKPLTSDMTEASAEFNRQWIEAKANAGGFADVLSGQIIPLLNSALGSVNEFFDESRGGITEGVKQTFQGSTPEQGAKNLGLPEWMFMPLDEGGASGAWNAFTSMFDGGNYRDNVNIYSGIGASSSGPSVIPSSSAAPAPFSYGQSQPPIEVHANLMLDGSVIDKRIINVTERDYQTTLSEMTSNIKG
jgi:hypothetical protein